MRLNSVIVYISKTFYHIARKKQFLPQLFLFPINRSHFFYKYYDKNEKLLIILNVFILRWSRNGKTPKNEIGRSNDILPGE